MKYLIIAAGGALGTLLRYGTYAFSKLLFPLIFPFGTLIVNTFGSLVIGVLWGVFEVFPVGENTRNFMFIGLLGGFTTFSAFSIDTMNLWRSGQVSLAFLNIIANLLCGLCAVFAGYYVAHAGVSIVRNGK